jgi:hypothetical protein
MTQAGTRVQRGHGGRRFLESCPAGGQAAATQTAARAPCPVLPCAPIVPGPVGRHQRGEFVGRGQSIPLFGRPPCQAPRETVSESGPQRRRPNMRAGQRSRKRAETTNPSASRSRGGGCTRGGAGSSPVALARQGSAAPRCARGPGRARGARGELRAGSLRGPAGRVRGGCARGRLARKAPVRAREGGATARTGAGEGVGCGAGESGRK